STAGAGTLSARPHAGRGRDTLRQASGGREPPDDFIRGLTPPARREEGDTLMPIAEKDVRWVDEPKMGLAELLYLPALFSGLATTFRHMLKPSVTQQFPEERPQKETTIFARLPANYRGVHRLNRDEQGRTKCV